MIFKNCTSGMLKWSYTVDVSSTNGKLTEYVIYLFWFQGKVLIGKKGKNGLESAASAARTSKPVWILINITMIILHTWSYTVIIIIMYHEVFSLKHIYCIYFSLGRYKCRSGELRSLRSNRRAQKWQTQRNPLSYVYNAETMWWLCCTQRVWVQTSNH